jgi:hypothetical protein
VCTAGSRRPETPVFCALFNFFGFKIKGGLVFYFFNIVFVSFSSVNFIVILNLIMFKFYCYFFKFFLNLIGLLKCFLYLWLV